VSIGESRQTYAERPINPKRAAISERIDSLAQSITKALEYPETGKHAEWRGFRPLFAGKFRDGEGTAAAQGLGETCISPAS
jgi:hypothetical protein